MKSWKFYHGTSKPAYESIKKHGFVLGEIRHHNWLAPQGIYFAINRPLVARRYAKRACRSDISEETIVLEANINIPPQDKILDLTSDSGMNRFYKSYVKAQGLFSTTNITKLGQQIPSEYKDYINSIRQKHDETIKILNEANNQSEEKPNCFNWDSVAIQLIIDEDNVQLIIAVIQDGRTFNDSFAGKEPKYKSAPHYHGIRTRDHLQVCVTDLGIIDINSYRVRGKNLDINEFDDDFMSWITCIDCS